MPNAAATDSQGMDCSHEVEHVSGTVLSIAAYIRRGF